MNPGGKPVSDVRSAVMRVGHDVVRSTAVALAMEQLKAAKDVQAFHEQAEWIWRHSLEVAAIAYVITKKHTRLNPDEALFAGLVHDIGRFYLLSRATAYPELVDHPGELDALIQEWHPSIGQAVLHEFDLAEPTQKAVAEHEHHPAAYPPRQLVDVITLANRVAVHANPPKYAEHVERNLAPVDDPALVASLKESAEDIRTLLNALRG
jgi:putative nucleotidyltransferase with HDIG domain